MTRSSLVRSLPNLLSGSRGIFALFFLDERPFVRLLGIFFALCSDYLDGFLARRYQLATRLGVVLDPIMDKFFVLFAAAVFIAEGRLTLLELLALISRDLFLCVFAIYLNIRGTWSSYRCHAIWWGKVTTVGQLTLLLGLSMNFTPPNFLFTGFIILGLLTFMELCMGLSKEHISPKESPVVKGDDNNPPPLE